jgi:hypothetical protein
MTIVGCNLIFNAIQSQQTLRSEGYNLLLVQRHEISLIVKPSIFTLS